MTPSWTMAWDNTIMGSVPIYPGPPSAWVHVPSASHFPYFQHASERRSRAADAGRTGRGGVGWFILCNGADKHALLNAERRLASAFPGTTASLPLSLSLPASCRARNVQDGRLALLPIRRSPVNLLPLNLLVRRHSFFTA